MDTDESIRGGPSYLDSSQHDLIKLEPLIASRRDDETTLSKKGFIRQINISKTQVDRDAFIIQNRINHLSEEDNKALRKIQQTKALAEKIKQHSLERVSKAQAYKETQAELTKEVLRKKIAVIQMRQSTESAAAARKYTASHIVAAINAEAKKVRRQHLQEIELKSIAEVTTKQQAAQLVKKAEIEGKWSKPIKQIEIQTNV